MERTSLSRSGRIVIVIIVVVVVVIVVVINQILML